MAWARSGYCCRCGECCHGDPFGGEPTDQENPRRSEAMRRAPEREGWCPLLQFHLIHAQFLHLPATTCAGHIGHVPPGEEDPYYMSGCNVWPEDPAQIVDYPSCTYTFEWVDLPPITGTLNVSDPDDALA